MDKKRKPVPAKATGRVWRKRWIASKRPVFSFVWVFAAVLAAGNALAYAPASPQGQFGSYRRKVFSNHHQLVARAAAAILSGLGQDAWENDESISSSRFALSLGKGCDAVPSSLLVIAAIAALPASIRARLVGLAIILLLMQMLNLIRVVILFLIGAYWPGLFESAHLDIWPPIFVIFAVGCWTVWALWASRWVTAPTNVLET